MNSKEVLKTIGNNIRRCRKAKGLTIQQLADLLGNTRCTVNNYELGKRKYLGIVKCYNIAQILSVDIVEILSLKQTKGK